MSARLAPTEYLDRATGERHRERVFGEAELYFLYHHPLGRRLRVALINRPGFSRVYSLWKKTRLSRFRIEHFIRTYDVDADEAELPVDQYPSLDAFFSRRLRPGVRPICPRPETLAAPADGRMLALRITTDAQLPIKGQRVSVAHLLDQKEIPLWLHNGWALVVRLAPKDYHRFHFPAHGQAEASRFVAGKLESVHPIALQTGAASFVNQRCCTRLNCSRFGPMEMVEIGALTVGTIEQTYAPGTMVKGEEKGLFRLGGSTVVLLWGAQGPTPDADLLENSQAGLETLIQYGTAVARLGVTP